MFTYEHALSVLIYSGSICLLFGVVITACHGIVMDHRKRNADNEQREIDAELNEVKYQQEAYWSNKFKDLNRFGCAYIL